MTDTPVAEHDHEHEEPKPPGLEIDPQILVTVQQQYLANSQLHATQLEAAVVQGQRTIAQLEAHIETLEERIDNMKKAPKGKVKT